MLDRLKTLVSNNQPKINIKDVVVGKSLGNGGFKKLWTLYSATFKGTEICLFIINKETFKCFDNHEKKSLINILSKTPNKLHKIHHPAYLKIILPFTENNNYLYFGSEPIISALSSFFNNDVMDSQLDTYLETYSFDETTKSIGIHKIIECAEFCHDNLKLCIISIPPEEIFVDKNEDWKFGSLSLSTEPYNYLELYDEIDKMPSIYKPDHSFCSKEFTMREKINFENDFFPIALLSASLYNNGKSFMDNNKLNYENNLKKIFDVASLELSCLPPLIRSLFIYLAPSSTSHGISFIKIKKLEIFQQSGFICVNFIQNFLLLDNSTIIKELNSMGSYLSMIPKKIMTKNVVPFLSKLIYEKEYYCLAFGNFIIAASAYTDSDFKTVFMKPILLYLEKNSENNIIELFLENLKVFASKITQDEFNSHIFPYLAKLLVSNDINLQISTLKSIVQVKDYIDFEYFEKKILPMIMNIVLTQPINIQLLTNFIINISQILDKIKVPTIVDSIIQRFYNLNTNEKSLIMCKIGLFNKFYEFHCKDHKDIKLQNVVNLFLPFLIKLTFNESLNKKQYETCYVVLKKYMDLVDKLRKEQFLLQPSVATSNGISTKENVKKTTEINLTNLSTHLVPEYTINFQPSKNNQSVTIDLNDKIGKNLDLFGTNFNQKSEIPTNDYNNGFNLTHNQNINNSSYSINPISKSNYKKNDPNDLIDFF